MYFLLRQKAAAKNKAVKKDVSIKIDYGNVIGMNRQKFRDSKKVSKNLF